MPFAKVFDPQYGATGVRYTSRSARTARRFDARRVLRRTPWMVAPAKVATETAPIANPTASATLRLSLSTVEENAPGH